MRVIRFGAWDKEEGRMIYPDDVVSNVLENNLVTITREIEFIEKVKEKQPVWSMTRHQLEDILLDLRRERGKILERKNAGPVVR